MQFSRCFDLPSQSGKFENCETKAIPLLMTLFSVMNALISSILAKDMNTNGLTELLVNIEPQR